MRWFFDFLIIAFLTVDALLLVNLVHQFLHFRRRKAPRWKWWIFGIFFVFVGGAGVLVFYGSFIEPQRITARHIPLDISKEPTSRGTFRIALVSDFHAGTYLSERYVRRVADRISGEHPDVVLIAGDFISFGDNSRAPRLEPLGRLDVPYGVYGVLGNHDYADDPRMLESMLEALGITILRNEYMIFEKDGHRLAVVGADDLWFGTIDLEAASAGVPEGLPRILLAHNPDIVYLLDNLKFDAILAGHTHGGQIRLPGIGSIPPIPTALGRAYDRGVFDWNGTPLIITQGIGVTGPRARLFVPPEVMIIDVVY